MYKILISDPLDPAGLELLRGSGHEVRLLDESERPQLPEILAEYDALVVRSGTQVTAELLAAGKNLKVVGRAGIGVDNIDVTAATEAGILVVNAPTANLISATEHTFALMLGLARLLPSADGSLKGEAWKRKSFVGTELKDKTLGIIGFGRIGQQVARRAQAFDMEVIAYDPVIEGEFMRRRQVEPMALNDLLSKADIVTLHVPKTPETQNLLNDERFALMKEGALLVNCARGGVVDEAALLKALDSGRLAGAGVDVFAKEPPEDYALARHPKVVATPHLGASTREAQLRISTDTAKMVIAALDGSLAITAVNLPFRAAGRSGEPYLRLAEKLGLLAGGELEGAIKAVEVNLWNVPEEHHVGIGIAALKGALQRFHGPAVNYVNAEKLARSQGLDVVRAVHSTEEGPQSLSVTLRGERELTMKGTLLHEQDPRVTDFDGYQLEFRAKGQLLVVRNRDVPGVVGKLGTTLGLAGVNIAEIHLARREGNEHALAVVRVDQDIATPTLDELRAMPEIVSARVVDVGP